MLKQFLKSLRLAAALLLPVMAQAGEVTVAVASNFLSTAQQIATGFEAETGHRVAVVNGSTGALFAQISQGAPYDVFLSADRARIAALVQAGQISAANRKVYARGKLALVAGDPALLMGDDIRATLNGPYRRFAMANPALAPYGRAAQQVLARLNLKIGTKAVTGANAAQSAVFVKTGNADLGFVGLSQVKEIGGGWIDVPTDLYDPIEQDAGLLNRAIDHPAARAFYDYLSGQSSLDIIQAAGYGWPE